MKRLVLLGCVVCFALSAGVAGAYFTTQRSIADNVVTAGTVSVAVDPTVSAVTIDNLAPGAAQVRSFTVTNDGTLPSGVTVTSPLRK